MVREELGGILDDVGMDIDDFIWEVRGINFLKTVNTLLSESTEGRTRHKGGRAFARTCIHHEVRSAEVPKACFTYTQQMSRSVSM